VGANNSVAFEDAPVSVSKAAVDAALREAQVQSDMLAALEREIGVSKEFLTKVCSGRFLRHPTSSSYCAYRS
jgi:COP9 signalosome complex subunit 3